MSVLAAFGFVFIIAAFQAVSGPAYAIYGVRPDFIILSVVTIGILLPPPAIYASAFFAGALLDALSPGMAGPHMTGLLLSALLMARGRRMGIGATTKGMALLVGAGILAASAAPQIARWILEGPGLDSALIIVTTSAYTALFAYPFFRVLGPAIKWAAPRRNDYGIIRGRASWRGLG
jgi:rod shape-determining protein MreD